jgi:Xaa-Pro aminopeptidase
MGAVSEQSADPQPTQERGSNRSHRPTSEAFRAFIAEGWAAREERLPGRAESAPWAARRRERVGRRFPGERLVLPAGPLVTRSNDTDYRFRPHSAFAHLTGLGADREPDAVLVLHPVSGGAEAATDAPSHEAVLYFRPRAGRDTEEFYADARYGELWVGVRPSLAELAAETELTCAHIDRLDADLAADAAPLRVVTGADPAVDALVARTRADRAPSSPDGGAGDGGADVDPGSDDAADAELVEALRVQDVRAAIAVQKRHRDASVEAVTAAITSDG